MSKNEATPAETSTYADINERESLIALSPKTYHASLAASYDDGASQSSTDSGPMNQVRTSISTNDLSLSSSACFSEALRTSSSSGDSQQPCISVFNSSSGSVAQPSNPSQISLLSSATKPLSVAEYYSYSQHALTTNETVSVSSEEAISDCIRSISIDDQTSPTSRSLQQYANQDLQHSSQQRPYSNQSFQQPDLHVFQQPQSCEAENHFGDKSQQITQQIHHQFVSQFPKQVLQNMVQSYPNLHQSTQNILYQEHRPHQDHQVIKTSNFSRSSSDEDIFESSQSQSLRGNNDISAMPPSGSLSSSATRSALVSLSSTGVSPFKRNLDIQSSSSNLSSLSVSIDNLPVISPNSSLLVSSLSESTAISRLPVPKKQKIEGEMGLIHPVSPDTVSPNTLNDITSETLCSPASSEPPFFLASTLVSIFGRPIVRRQSKTECKSRYNVDSRWFSTNHEFSWLQAIRPTPHECIHAENALIFDESGTNGNNIVKSSRVVVSQTQSSTSPKDMNNTGRTHRTTRPNWRLRTREFDLWDKDDLSDSDVEQPEFTLLDITSRSSHKNSRARDLMQRTYFTRLCKQSSTSIPATSILGTTSNKDSNMTVLEVVRRETFPLVFRSLYEDYRSDRRKPTMTFSLEWLHSAYSSLTTILSKKHALTKASQREIASLLGPGTDFAELFDEVLAIVDRDARIEGDTNVTEIDTFLQKKNLEQFEHYKELKATITRDIHGPSLANFLFSFDRQALERGLRPDKQSENSMLASKPDTATSTIIAQPICNESNMTDSESEALRFHYRNVWCYPSEWRYASMGLIYHRFCQMADLVHAEPSRINALALHYPQEMSSNSTNVFQESIRELVLGQEGPLNLPQAKSQDNSDILKSELQAEKMQGSKEDDTSDSSDIMGEKTTSTSRPVSPFSALPTEACDENLSMPYRVFDSQLLGDLYQYTTFLWELEEGQVFRAVTPHDYPDIKFRRLIVDWVAEWAEKNKLQPVTTDLGLRLFDYVLGRGARPSRAELQAYAVVCLAIASKINESYSSNVVHTASLSSFSALIHIDLSRMRAIEMHIMRLLSFRPFLATPVTFMLVAGEFGLITGSSINVFTSKAHDKLTRFHIRYVKFFTDLYVQCGDIAGALPSVIAAAIVICVRASISLKPLVPSDLSKIVRIDIHCNQLLTVFTLLYQFFVDSFPAVGRDPEVVPQAKRDILALAKKQRTRREILWIMSHTTPSRELLRNLPSILLSEQMQEQEHAQEQKQKHEGEFEEKNLQEKGQDIEQERFQQKLRNFGIPFNSCQVMLGAVRCPAFLERTHSQSLASATRSFTEMSDVSVSTDEQGQGCIKRQKINQ